MSYEQIKVEERRAIVGYCDVVGFTAWMELCAASGSDVTVFIQQMKWQLINFRDYSGYHSIPAGDGLLAVLDWKMGSDPIGTLGFIKALSALGVELSALAGQIPNPRPGPTRIRITGGNLWRTEETPFSELPSIRKIDFFGEPLNKGSRYLDVSREIPNIITRTALESMTPDERNQLRVESLNFRGGHIPRGVRVEDMQDLRTFQLK